MAHVRDHQCFFDGEALKRAREYFAIDDDFMLMAMMAEVLFGRHQRGRSKGTVIWTEWKYLELGEAYAEIRAKDPKLSDAGIAKLLAKTDAYKSYPAEVLRQRLPEAKRYLEAYYDAGGREARWVKRAVKVV